MVQNSIKRNLSVAAILNYTRHFELRLHFLITATKVI